MAIDENETENEETPSKSKGKARTKKAPASTKAVPPAPPETEEPPNARIFNGGNSTVPKHSKPAGVASKIKARTFLAWVTSLVKRETPPHHFVCELADGDTKSTLLTKSRSGNVLVGECVSTIETFEPVKVEAWARDEETAEENSLGWWVFPRKVEPPETTTQDHTASFVMPPAPAPGYLPEEGDSEATRQMKTFTHLLADAYRYNAEATIALVRHNADATKGMLDAMSRVMEMQANAFARERESLDRTVQTREKLAKLNAGKFRVAANATSASEAQNRQEEEEEEIEENSNDQLFGAFMHTVVTEFGRRTAAAAAPSPAVPDAKP